MTTTEQKTSNATNPLSPNGGKRSNRVEKIGVTILALGVIAFLIGFVASRNQDTQEPVVSETQSPYPDEAQPTTEQPLTEAQAILQTAIENTQVQSETPEVLSETPEVATEEPEAATDTESPVVNEGNTGP